jgi:hypothetical protein
MSTDRGKDIDPMDPDADSGLSGKIIGCAIEVSNGLGIGFVRRTAKADDR